MAKRTLNPDWTDRYLRNELTADEIVKFEEALMDSPDMQQELETVLGLQEALALIPERALESRAGHTPPSRVGLRHVAFAAALLLALFSTVMLWKVSNENAGLRAELAQLGQPREIVLRIPVDTLRAGRAGRDPDLVIKKPENHAALLFDIDYGTMGRNNDRIFFELTDEEGAVLMSWSIEGERKGRSSVVINNEEIPPGRFWLRFLSADGKELDKRLLQFY